MTARRSWARLISSILLISAAGCGAGGPSAALIGVWNASYNDPTFGPGAVQLILNADGTFQEQYIYQAGSVITVFGTFRVFETEGLLRLDITRGEPAETCGPLGCTAIIYPAGESYGYSIIDANTLQLDIANCDPTVTVCGYTHIRQV